ncbi:MAG: hypothetical protein SCALA702_28170 [Melioribacteraceae bacterium]|nr:MAG: hypothetical protein SCALA702_28170 [Melioribacteraceae bacterium]
MKKILLIIAVLLLSVNLYAQEKSGSKAELSEELKDLQMRFLKISDADTNKADMNAEVFSRDLVPTEGSPVIQQQSKKPLAAQFWIDRKDKKGKWKAVNINKNLRLRDNEEIVLWCNISKPGYVYVYNQGPGKKKATRIFPVSKKEIKKLNANVSQRIAKFKVVAPTGIEALTIIVSKTRLPHLEGDLNSYVPTSNVTSSYKPETVPSSGSTPGVEVINGQVDEILASLNSKALKADQKISRDIIAVTQSDQQSVIFSTSSNTNAGSFAKTFLIRHVK